MMNSPTSPDLESRLRTIEDKLAIYELIASHPPSAHTGHANYTLSVYREDGVFDRGPTLDGAQGVRNIAAFIQRLAKRTLLPVDGSEAHRDLLRKGLDDLPHLT